jgi:hypothetical protein
MVEIYNPLLHAVGTIVDPRVLLPLLPCETMQAKQEPIFGLHHMFLCRITKQGT